MILNIACRLTNWKKSASYAGLLLFSQCSQSCISAFTFWQMVFNLWSCPLRWISNSNTIFRSLASVLEMVQNIRQNGHSTGLVQCTLRSLVHFWREPHAMILLAQCLFFISFFLISLKHGYRSGICQWK